MSKCTQIIDKKLAKKINDPRSLRIKATFSCVVRNLWSHPCQENWVKFKGVRPSIMPGLPTYLVQELNAGTVKEEEVSADSDYTWSRHFSPFNAQSTRTQSF